MNSRRDFFRKSALVAGASVIPATKILADDPVQTTATTTGKLGSSSHLGTVIHAGIG